jgi:hypothetical protein
MAAAAADHATTSGRDRADGESDGNEVNEGTPGNNAVVLVAHSRVIRTLLQEYGSFFSLC